MKGRGGEGGDRSTGTSGTTAAGCPCFCSKTCLSANALLQVLLRAQCVLPAASKTFLLPSSFVPVSPYEVSMTKRSRRQEAGNSALAYDNESGRVAPAQLGSRAALGQPTIAPKEGL